MEYWPPERAKLESGPEPTLARKVAIVTGAAGAIGRATSRVLLERGCHVVLTDLPGDPLDNTARELRDRFADAVDAQPMDVTDESSVERVFAHTTLHFGGLDILVANAGIAHVGAIDSLELSDWQRVHAVNETGTFLCFRAAARVFRAQRLGGRLILNASKNVPAPGADFAAYSASKAGAVQVAKVAAIELAELGVTVNFVHADGVFEDETSGKSSGLWDTVGPDRMASRGLDAQGLREFYRNRNLMKVPVSARHVAEAIAFFAEARTPTTGAALTVDGGHRDTFYR